MSHLRAFLRYCPPTWCPVLRYAWLCCYARLGTQAGYAATRGLVLKLAKLLREAWYSSWLSCYARSGTEEGYEGIRLSHASASSAEEEGGPKCMLLCGVRYRDSIWCYALCGTGTGLAYGAIGLRARYAVSGTEVADGGGLQSGGCRECEKWRTKVCYNAHTLSVLQILCVVNAATGYQYCRSDVVYTTTRYLSASDIMLYRRPHAFSVHAIFLPMHGNQLSYGAMLTAYGCAVLT
eukprot:890240-Rhodomonas_salina.1